MALNAYSLTLGGDRNKQHIFDRTFQLFEPLLCRFGGRTGRTGGHNGICD